MPDSLLPRLDLVPSRPALRRAAATEVTLLVRVTAPDRPATATPVARPRLNLAFSIDVSGSMSGPKLDHAKAAILHALTVLGDDDHVSVVAFASTVEVVVPSMAARNRAFVADAVRRLHTRGSTALHEGWRVAGVEVAGAFDPNALNRVILLTDGQANVGLADAPTVSGHVRELAARGISTSAFGIGRDYNEDLLEAMADAGDGTYAFVASPADLPKLFDAELSGLATTFARDVTVRLSRAAGVELVTVLNDLPVRRGVTIDEPHADPDGAIHGLGGLRARPDRWQWTALPNLIYGQTRDLVVRLRVAPSHTAAAAVDVPICEAVLAWTPAGEARRHAAVLDVLALPTVDAAEYDALADDRDVLAAAARQESSRYARQSGDAASRGDLRMARRQMSFAMEASAEFVASHPEMADDLAVYRRSDEALLDNDALLAAKEAKAAAYRSKRADR